MLVIADIDKQKSNVDRKTRSAKKKITLLKDGKMRENKI